MCVVVRGFETIISVTELTALTIVVQLTTVLLHSLLSDGRRPQTAWLRSRFESEGGLTRQCYNTTINYLALRKCPVEASLRMLHPECTQRAQ